MANSPESRFDGQPSIFLIHQPADFPFAFHPKMGYGEVSEHTLPEASELVPTDVVYEGAEIPR